MTLDTPLLDQVNAPSDLRKLEKSQLRQLADELRAEMIDAVSVTGGHLGSGLGVVELTTALHYVFNTPDDRLVWDVGHQCYPHKILTGRRDRIRTLRQPGGLSGFTKRSESEYAPFGAAHAATSISAATGFAEAARHNGNDTTAIAVIGDGSMSGGMAYEGLNNAGHLGSKVLVVLNDNDMSIAPPVGAMSAYLARVSSSGVYQGFRTFGKQLAKRLPHAVYKQLAKAEEYGRGMVTGGTLFEELGFYYVGPIDGHNLDQLVPVLENIRDKVDGPVLLHVVTRKGAGYPPAEESADKYHGVAKFDVVSGKQKKGTPNAPAYQKVFGNTLVKEAETDERIIGVTAAMPSGTSLDLFADAYPDRCYDVGIAEQHAVTFAAGLAADGLRPFAAIYSTFLQRAYDSVVHDVAIQNLPVRFPMDRAGLVGSDGQTHAGAFDISYLGCLPNMVLMAAGDEAELVHMTSTAVAYDEGPIAFRYPRGEGVGVELPERGSILEIGKGRVVREGSKIALLSYGGRLSETLKAAEILEGLGLSTTVADARFAKPLDHDLINRLVANHEVVITIEEGSRGGFGAFVLHYMADAGLLDRGCKIRTMTLPDIFQDQDSPYNMYETAQLNANQIAARARSALGDTADIVNLHG